MKTWAAIVAAVIVIGLASFTAGRYSAPTKTVRETVTVEKKVEVEKVVVRTVEVAKAHEVVRWRTRIVTMPDGTRDETVETVKEDTKETGREAVSKEEHKTLEQKAVATRVETIREVYRPNWYIGARGTINLDGEVSYGPEISRRIFGGIWISGGALIQARAATVGVGITF